MLPVSRSRLLTLALGLLIAATPAAAQSNGPDLAVMLGQAQRYTVKVRGTVVWPFMGEQLGSGTGTGFIVDLERGWILTNAHVAKRSLSTVEIAMGDTENEWLPVERVYVDNLLDIAVLKIDRAKLPDDAMSAKLGCRQTVKQGATVVAYGHPISLNFTATRGIVSSVRSLGPIEFVQMDANINPGNSGGPLLIVEPPEVIGINTLNIAGAPGLGLAVAIRHVCPILELLAKGEDPGLPSLPVYWLKQGRIETLTVAALFPRREGEAPATGSSNNGQGLKVGDIVQGFVDGPKVTSVADLYSALRGRKEQVTLQVLREGKTVDISATLIPPRAPLRRQAATFAGLLIAERPNLDSIDLLPPLRIEFIKPGEAGQRAGFMLGDHLEAVGGQRFNTVVALHDWLRSRSSSEKIAILVRRGSSFDTRVIAEYHRFEIPLSDLKLMTAGE